MQNYIDVTPGAGPGTGGGTTINPGESFPKQPSSPAPGQVPSERPHVPSSPMPGQTPTEKPKGPPDVIPGKNPPEEKPGRA